MRNAGDALTQKSVVEAMFHMQEVLNKDERPLQLSSFEGHSKYLYEQLSQRRELKENVDDRETLIMRIVTAFNQALPGNERKYVRKQKSYAGDLHS